MSVIFALLCALFASLVLASHRGVRALTQRRAGRASGYLGAAASAARRADATALAALAPSSTHLGSALTAALEARAAGGRPSLAVREQLISTRALAANVLTPLRGGATLGSALGLAGALLAYLAGPPETFPLEQLEQGGIELARMGRAALSIVAGLGVHAYGMQAYAALRRDAREILSELGELEEIVAGAEEIGA